MKHLKVIAALFIFHAITLLFVPSLPRNVSATNNQQKRARPNSGAKPTATKPAPTKPEYYFAAAMAMQKDGKIVVVGRSGDIRESKIFVSRYKTDGGLDPAFDGDGKVTTSFGGSTTATDVAIQRDGKIIVVGSSGDPGSSFAIARYNANGSLDSTFDVDGKVTTDFGGLGGSSSASAVAIQSDGKIIVAGGGSSDSDYGFAITRYNTNGSLDTTFSGDGKLITNVGPAGAASDVGIQSDGKIVAVGHDQDEQEKNFVLVRYQSNGELDSAFGGKGKVITDLGDFDSATSLTLQRDGKIVVVGESGPGSKSQLAIARYNSDGAADLTFDRDGKLTLKVGAIASGLAVEVQGDGKILVGGNVFSATPQNKEFGSNNFLLLRCHPDGTIDTNFASDGKVITDLGKDEYTAGMAVQSDGRIILAGTIDDDQTGKREIAIVRYNTDGTIDSSFNPRP